MSTRYNPFSVLLPELNMRSLIHQELFPGNTEWTPHVDIKEDEKQICIMIDIPGVDPKDIQLEISDEMLTISGEKITEAQKSSEGYTRIERFSGKFSRRFSISASVQVEKITAKTAHGVLSITLPKTQRSTTRRIPVQSFD